LSREPAPTAEPVSRLIQEFNKLPGIGPKSAQRIAYYLLRADEMENQSLAEAILQVLFVSMSRKLTFAMFAAASPVTALKYAS
jgi:recombinational DNA repair protein RecR